MILDACVLIDFISADRSVLELLVNYVGKLYVASPVVDEINEIKNESELTALGIVVVEPEIEDAYSAANITGATSFQDRLFFFTAKRHGLACVTNDKNLRKLCEKEGVTILWGLELLAKLHKTGGIPGKQAIMIAQQIRAKNPKHITEKIVTRLTEIIKKQ
jgi:rRNA-processing protein FCF1